MPFSFVVDAKPGPEAKFKRAVFHHCGYFHFLHSHASGSADRSGDGCKRVAAQPNSGHRSNNSAVSMQWKITLRPKSRQTNNPSIIAIVRIGGLETSITLLDYVRYSETSLTQENSVGFANASVTT